MTPLSLREQSVQAFASIIPPAQEGHISPQAAFASIMPQAQDGSFETGRLSAGAHSISDGGQATFTRNHYKVKPSISDFVVDVELAARRSLTVEEFNYFKRTYFVEFLGVADLRDAMDCTPDGRDKFFAKFLESFPEDKRHEIEMFDRGIREKVGAALIARGIYPYNQYMNFSDLDVRKRFDQ